VLCLLDRGAQKIGIMKVVKTVEEMQQTARECRMSGRRIALVPTMGALHEGHLSLIDQARESADLVIVSIYVNPAQFAPNEDFNAYPRTLERDLEICQTKGVNYVFAPSDSEMYPEDHSYYVDEERLSKTLCGESRQNHFRGVSTICTKLFNITCPDFVVVGMKDAQQAILLNRLIRNLNFPIELIVGPTVRDEDGLALSSRNKNLTSGQRTEALKIYKSLMAAQALVDKGISNTDRLKAEVTNHLNSLRLRVIYVKTVNLETLQEIREVVPGQTLLAVAVWVDQVRLIDNLVL
jgi:pantoate--beta-alanine ligase